MISFKAEFVEVHHARLLSARDEWAARGVRRYLAICRQDARRAIKLRVLTERQQARLYHGTVEQRRRTREIARKKRAATSRPGEPPVSHVRTDAGSIRDIRYDFNRQALSGIYGYFRHNSARGRDVPHVLEYGGAGQARPRGGRGASSFTMQARPNINATAQRNYPKLEQFLTDTMK